MVAVPWPDPGTEPAAHQPARLLVTGRAREPSGLVTTGSTGSSNRIGGLVVEIPPDPAATAGPVGELPRDRMDRATGTPGRDTCVAGETSFGEPVTASADAGADGNEGADEGIGTSPTSAGGADTDAVAVAGPVDG